MKRIVTSLVLVGALAAVLAPAPARADEYGYKRTLERSVPVAGASALGVRGFNGNVHLYADGGSTVRIHAVLGARSADALAALDVRTSRLPDGTLHIEEICPSSRRLVFWSFRDCDIELDVRYPKALAVSLSSENGNLTIAGARTAISVKNENGNIRVDGAGGPVSINNGNGNVTLSGAPENVSIANGNGNLNVGLAPDWHGKAIALHTNAGNIHLRVPAGFAATINTKVTLGEVENNAGVSKGAATVDMSATFGNLIVSRE